MVQLEHHLTLVLANATAVRNLPGRKSDVSDAPWLADLLAHGLVRGSFVPPAPIQALRELARLPLVLLKSPTEARRRARHATVHWLEAIYNRRRRHRHSAIDMLSPSTTRSATGIAAQRLNVGATRAGQDQSSPSSS